MNDDKKNQDPEDEPERTEAGDPIYRYKPKDPSWTPADMDDSAMEAISDHIAKHIGQIGNVWHELVSDLVHIDVHQIPPTDERPYWTLVTSGMSDLPMVTPEGQEEHAFAELMICLPRDWKMDQTDFKDERHYWPIRWLKMLARFPHQYKTWLWRGHTMPNGDPAAPLCDGVPFDGVILLRPKTVSTECWSLPIRADKTIHFFAVVPLYPGEMALKLREGSAKLEQLFEKQKISELVNLQRRDVSQREWWRLW